MELSFRRLGPWMAIVVLIVVGSVTMAVSGLPSNPAPASARAVPPSGGGVVFGVDYADQLPEESGSALAHSLDDAVAVGANWIRIDLAWYRIQTWWQAHGYGQVARSYVEAVKAWDRGDRIDVLHPASGLDHGHAGHS